MKVSATNIEIVFVPKKNPASNYDSVTGSIYTLSPMAYYIIKFLLYLLFMSLTDMHSKLKLCYFTQSFNRLAVLLTYSYMFMLCSTMQTKYFRF